MADQLNDKAFAREFAQQMLLVLEGEEHATVNPARYALIREKLEVMSAYLIQQHPQVDIGDDFNYRRFGDVVQESLGQMYLPLLNQQYNSDTKIDANFEQLSDACIDAALEVYAYHGRAAQEILEDHAAEQTHSFETYVPSPTPYLGKQAIPTNGFGTTLDSIKSAAQPHADRLKSRANKILTNLADHWDEVTLGAKRKTVLQYGLMGAMLFSDSPTIKLTRDNQHTQWAAADAKLNHWAAQYSNYFQSQLQQASHGGVEGFAPLSYQDGATLRTGFGTSMDTKEARKGFHKLGIDYDGIRNDEVHLTQDQAFLLLDWRATQHANAKAGEVAPEEKANALEDIHSSNTDIKNLLQNYLMAPEQFAFKESKKSKKQERVASTHTKKDAADHLYQQTAHLYKQSAEAAPSTPKAEEKPRVVEWDIAAERAAPKQDQKPAKASTNIKAIEADIQAAAATAILTAQPVAASETEHTPSILERIGRAVSEIKTITPKIISTSINPLAAKYKDTEQKLGERFAKAETDDALSHAEKKALKKQGVGVIAATTTPSENPNAYMSRPLLEKTLAGLENASQKRDYGNYNDPASRTFYAGLGIALEGAEGEGAFVYKCSSKKPTVGFGCRVDIAGNREKINTFFNGKYDGMKLLRGQQGIAKEDARALLHSMLADYEKTLVNFIGKETYAKLPVGLQAALVDMTYNGGAGEKKGRKGKNGLVGPTMKRLLQAEKYEEAVTHIAAYCNANNLAGLGDRRTFIVGLVAGSADVVGGAKQAALKIEQQLQRNLKTAHNNDMIVIETDAELSVKHLENYAPTLEKVVKNLDTPVLITSSTGDTVLVQREGKEVSFIDDFRGTTNKAVGRFTEMLEARADSEQQGKNGRL